MKVSKVSLETVEDLIYTLLSLKNKLKVHVLAVKLGVDKVDDEEIAKTLQEFKEAAWTLAALLEEAVRLSVLAEVKEDV